MGGFPRSSFEIVRVGVLGLSVNTGVFGLESDWFGVLGLLGTTGFDPSTVS
jgi:hypothetical protein